MREPTVADVMTRQVITAVPDTPFKELAGTMLAHDLDALPVIDSAGRPVGVVAEADIVTKLEFHGGADPAPLLARARWYKSLALHAADLMAAPAITTTPNIAVSSAIHLMARRRIRQVCVVDRAGYLVGILARRDILPLFVRNDSAIEADIEREVADNARRGHQVIVHVTDGVVTLEGTLTLHSAVDRIGGITSRVPGVIAVHNNLHYDIDDLMITGF